ncbi:leucine-rich repeats and immunoglobulin-like domains protein 2 [Solea senegalensis]|uniref:leucine-rich repeats and immunoglobulin-like domains protein 2 n=1 Tax=Solea senegalensis TaxID=28829 RepID=UPI001C41108F|nr:leucine-rich repeats and immunoglobulin-like domains protein 2 [Solea senegalensis]KAG7494683.1 leucine-rich repeats and immunoglobulin-like domains protein 2 [Solea senegalensis]
MAEGWPIPSALVFMLFGVSACALESCPAPCLCSEGQDDVRVLDCNRKRLSTPPLDPPDGITHVTMNYNELAVLPFLGDVSSNITSLSLVHNKITELSIHQLQPYISLETLDLTSNAISELKVGSFPNMQLKYLNLSNNKISILEPGCFENISGTLLVLKLNRNRLATLPSKVFRLPQLQFLEMKRNKIKIVDSLTFKGMDSLKSLKMQRNGISKLMDGAFFGLNNIEELELEHNNLTEVNKGWLYGLRMLRILRVNQNGVFIIRPDAWEFCQKLEELDLSFNHMTRLEETAFVGLSFLESLNLGENSISHLGEGVFSGLSSLRTLDIRNNEISWAIEDSIGLFDGMKKLNTIILQRNKIKSITKKAFEGLEELEHLDLSKNGIMSIHPEALSHMKLKVFVLNTSSLLCDCHMQWLGPWLTDSQFQQSVTAVCAHPPSLLGRSVLTISPEEFVCDDFPKPRITTHPETSVALRGNNVTLSCVASSSSDLPMATAWRKDGEVLYDAEVQNFAQFQEGELIYTTMLHLLNVNFTDEGRYQCVVSNHFGSNYSNRAKLTVNEMPSFLKTPMDLTIRTGTMARLECAAEGHPSPQIAWQKDGGTDFPAARERRMHVMPDDDIFFIANVKTEDMGIYSCTAQNAAGSLSANATLTVLETPSIVRPLEDRTVARGETAVLQCIAGGSPAPRLNWTKDDGPLVLTERHFFAAANQLLIIVDAGPADAGKYTCIMSNTLGTERGHIYLGVSPSPNCDTGAGYDQDGWTTVGIVVIVVVCCVVGTSLVWVIVIYHMRRKSEDYSITNTDEMNLPADIPSYLSSQGTLSEPQEGYSNSEAGSHQQLMPPLSNGYIHKGTDGVCYGDMSSEVETEGNGLLHCRVGSLFTGRSSFHPGEPREGVSAVPTGGAGSLVICSDCYDNANIYSRTREYCPYAYMGEDELLDKTLPDLKESFSEHAQHMDTTLENLISNQNSSVFLSSHDKRLGSHTPLDHANDFLGRSFWGEDLCQHPVIVHRTPPLTSTADGAEEQSEGDVDYFPSQSTQDHRSASNRTNPQEHSAPT